MILQAHIILALILAMLPIGCYVDADLQQDETEIVKLAETTKEADLTDKTCVYGTCPNTNSEEKTIPTNLDECGVWLAPSSIPGAGLGMYAGRDFKEGELLQPSGEIVVPQIDINQHQFELGDAFHNLWDEYTWSGASLYMDNEGFVEVKVQSPGFGSAANSFIDLINVDERRPYQSTPQGIHQSKDPGAGAFSTYHNRESVATVPIQRGEELFVDYGEKWFQDRPQLGPIPLLGDLEAATNVFRGHMEVRKKHPKVASEIFDDLWVTFIEGNEFKDSRVMGAFHHTRSEWENLWYGKTMKEIRIGEGMRTDEWLREHGTCADNMREGESTIPQAGRGAFATRKLIKDTVVAPLPLIHVSDYHLFEMLEFEDIRTLKTDKKRNGMQLGMNYCFGHGSSTLMLCPYGPLTSLINHNQTQANVRLKWADPSVGNHEAELLSRPIEHFAKDKTAKLAMELVAIRDIMPGEEIFLDYGSEWEAAWQEHVKNWKPFFVEAEQYVSAWHLNNSPDRLRTEFEQMEQPYPGNVDLKCDHKFFHTIDYDHFQLTGQIFVTDFHGSSWYNCEILRFEEVNGILRYTAIVMLEDNKNDKLSRAPREAFRFADRPYTTDMFLPNAFRHPMMIPDDMFPEYWMNQ